MESEFVFMTDKNNDDADVHVTRRPKNVPATKQDVELPRGALQWE